ncbi:MAG TPA: toll/interleukin-1 receptor domain-containing protein [Symbiobacteriaceae bacterium]|jgi:hypothetical protein
MPKLATDCLVICHPDDRPRVRGVKAALGGLGVDAWVDEDELLLGARILQEWERAVESHRHVFLFWSAAVARDEQWVRLQYESALTAHRSVICICLDETPLPPVLGRFQPIRGARGLTDGELAVAIARTVAELPLPGLALFPCDLPLDLGPADPLEVLLIRTAPVTPDLLAEVLTWAAKKRPDLPLLVVGPHGGATGADAGELEAVIAEGCPPNVAIVLAMGEVPYDEIPGKLRVLPGVDRSSAWPVAACWAGGAGGAYQVDVGGPAVFGRIGPQMPLFRTPGGFTLGLLSLSEGTAEVGQMAAGLYARALRLMTGGPERLDLCLLLAPAGPGEGAAARRLLQETARDPAASRAVLGHAGGLYTAESCTPYLEAGPCAYRAMFDPGAGRLQNAVYRPVGADGRLGATEPASPLRQLIKRLTADLQPEPCRHPEVGAAVARSFEGVRRSLLDTIGEERRQAILDLLRFPERHDGQAGDGIHDLALALAKLGLAGPLDLDQPSQCCTARCADRRHVAVLSGGRRQWAQQTVADFCSRLYGSEESAEFSPFGLTVVVLEHYGPCPGVDVYHPAHTGGNFEVAGELAAELAPPEPPVRFCSLRTLEGLLNECDSEAGIRDRLREVI